jgi:hypothetical protein
MKGHDIRTEENSSVLKVRLFSLPVRKIFRILKPCEENLERTPPGHIPAKKFAS